MTPFQQEHSSPTADQEYLKFINHHPEEFLLIKTYKAAINVNICYDSRGGVCVCAYPTALQMVNGLRIVVLGLLHEY